MLGDWRLCHGDLDFPSCFEIAQVAYLAVRALTQFEPGLYPRVGPIRDRIRATWDAERAAATPAGP